MIWAAALLVFGAVLLAAAFAIATRRLLEWASEREQSLDLQRTALEERHAERERLWLEERRELLDRIQNPHGAVMKALGEAPSADEPAQTDDVVDRAFAAEHPAEAGVPWDPDLEPFDFEMPQAEEAVAPLPDDVPAEVLP